MAAEQRSQQTASTATRSRDKLAVPHCKAIMSQTERWFKIEQLIKARGVVSLEAPERYTHVGAEQTIRLQ